MAGENEEHLLLHPITTNHHRKAHENPSPEGDKKDIQRHNKALKPPPAHGLGSHLLDAEPGFDQKGPMQNPEPDEAAKYKIRFLDFVHRVATVMVFVVVASLNKEVIKCMIPVVSERIQSLVASFPVGVGTVCSLIH